MDRPKRFILYLKYTIAYGTPICMMLFLFLSNRSLFLDSLNLARNIVELSFWELTGPLHYQQSAPILFLFLSKFSIALFGVSEYALRLIPLVSGILTLYFLGKVFQKSLHLKYVLLGVFWFGCNAMVLRYSTEFKQYITDAMVGLVLIWLAQKINQITNKNVMLYGIVGAVCIWLSMPAIFILFGSIIYFATITNKNIKSMSPILLLAAWFTIHFLLEYYLILNSAIESDHMKNFHASYFIQGRFWQMDALQHDLGLLISSLRMVVGKSGIALGMAICLICVSIYQMITEKFKIGILFIVPILAAFGASFFGLYSLIERLILFSLPLFLFLILSGVQHLEKLLSQKSRVLKYSIFVLLSITFLVSFNQTQGIKYIVDPFEKEDNRSSLEYIHNHPSSSNLIISSQLAFPAYAYYTEYDKNYNYLKLGEVIPANYGESIVDIANQKSREKEQSIWVLLGHMNDKEISTIINGLDKVGTIKNSYRSNQSAAILFSTQ